VRFSYFPGAQRALAAFTILGNSKRRDHQRGHPAKLGREAIENLNTPEFKLNKPSGRHPKTRFGEGAVNRAGSVHRCLSATRWTREDVRAAVQGKGELAKNEDRR